jgi:hypothetical protein
LLTYDLVAALDDPLPVTKTIPPLVVPVLATPMVTELVATPPMVVVEVLVAPTTTAPVDVEEPLVPVP